MLVTNDPSARRVMRCCEDALATKKTLSRPEVAALFRAARDEHTGTIEKGGAEALAWVRETYGDRMDNEGAEAFGTYAAEYQLDMFLADLKERDEAALKTLARQREDWAEFAKKDDIVRAARKSDLVKKRMKRLKATPKQTTEVVVRTGHVNPSAAQRRPDADPNAPDPHEVGIARAEAAKTKL
jgi:hypothetical protein